MIKFRFERDCIMYHQYIQTSKVSHPYFIGAFGLNCFTSAHKYWKLTLT